jgi:hypothetical protein
MTKWYGFQTESQPQILHSSASRREIYQDLVSLYQKGYIDWKDGWVQICEPMASVVDVLQQSHYAILLHSQGDYPLHQSYYYTDKKVVQIEVSQREANTLIVQHSKPDNFIHDLWKTGVFPEEDLQVDASREISISTEKIAVTTNIVLMNLKTGVEESKIQIGEAGVDDYIIYTTQERCQIVPYQKVCCVRHIKEWINRR